jgi:hypothetical protein
MAVYFRNHKKHINTLSLRMETECVSETSEAFKQLTRLSAREEFIHKHAAREKYLSAHKIIINLWSSTKFIK